MIDLESDYHIHANYNDHSSPDLTITNIILRAKSMKLKNIAITEHVRKSSDWVEKYVNEIMQSVNNEYDDNDNLNNNLKVITGFEAKILKNGEIDCHDKYMKKYFIIASFHTIYNDKSIWLNALKSAIKNPNVDVIGHLAPEQTFTLETNEIEELADLLRSNNKIIELNAKYCRPPVEIIKIFDKYGVRFHLGSDAHSLHEIGEFKRLKDLIAAIS